MKDNNRLKVAVIGSGAAGLTATKCLVEPGSGFQCVTFEQSDNVGGTWVYTDQVGKDEYGLPVHSSMYQGLRTNLPKEIMSLPDYPFQGKSKSSYVTSQEVLEYFEEYADYFDLRKHIKFRHHVNMITPVANGRWKIKVTDLKRQKGSVYYFDAVIVCIGNYSNPVYPQLPGTGIFKGIQMHSHDYKHPSCFKNMKVIVMGAGPSGLDIANQISSRASEVYLSHHSEMVRKMAFHDNVIHKGDPQQLTTNGIIFEDGSQENIDAIVYCTGYEYKYPFLSPECNISVENMVVRPLYKHFLNIEHPTMCIIGIPRDCPGFTLFNLQVRCFINILKNRSVLPSKSEMYEETGKDMDDRLNITGKTKYYHKMNKHAQSYFDSVSTLGNLPKTRNIIFDIYFNGMDHMFKDFQNFRKKIYSIKNDERFEVSEL